MKFEIKDKNWKRYNLFWNYKSFDIHVFDEGNSRTTLPFSFNIHHAAAYGYHLSRFFTELQELLNSFED